MVLNARPAAEKKDADVVLNACPWFTVSTPAVLVRPLPVREVKYEELRPRTVAVRPVVVAEPCTRRLPVVVAPPKMVRPEIAVPPPMVDEAVERIPPESVESPVTPSVPERVCDAAVIVPVKVGLADKTMLPVPVTALERVTPPYVSAPVCVRVPVCVVLPETVSAPSVAVPTVAELLKRFVDEAVVVKKVVAVALPKVTFCVSWYATDVVE